MKQPHGPPMALGNMRELGVHHLIAHCLRMTYWPKLVSMMDQRGKPIRLVGRNPLSAPISESFGPVNKYINP